MLDVHILCNVNCLVQRQKKQHRCGLQPSGENEALITSKQEEQRDSWTRDTETIQREICLEIDPPWSQRDEEVWFGRCYPRDH